MHKFKSRSAQNVIGLKLSGTLSRAEYHEIVPYLEEKIKEYGKIRLLIELDHWEGWGAYAAFNDMFFVLKNSFKIERVAFLLKSEADKRAVLLAKPFTPWSRDSTRYFGPEESEAAWLWVGEGVANFAIPSDEDFDLKEKEEKKKKVRYGPKQTVLIIGGGVSGTALAALLEQRGFKPTLADIGDPALEADRALQIWPNGGGILKSLRLYKKVLKNSSIVSYYDIYNSKGTFMHRYDNVQFEEKYGSILLASRNKLIKVMNKLIMPKLAYKTVTATKLKEVEEGVKVTFSDGTKGFYDCVVCIEGLHSKMRELVLDKEPERFSGTIGWLFSVKPDFDFPQGITLYSGKNEFINFSKIGEKVYGFACMKHEELKTQEKHLDLFKNAFKDYPTIVKQVINLIKEDEVIKHDGLYQILPEIYARGRIAFLEEAAYAFLPTTILGDSLALESAAFLADQLSRSDSKKVNRALQNYSNYKINRTAAVVKACKIKELEPLFHAENMTKMDSKELDAEEKYQEFWKSFLEEEV